MAAGFTVSSRVATWKNGHARPDVLQTLSEARGVAAVRKVVVAGASLAALVIPRPEVPEGVGGDSPPRPLRAGWSIEVVTTLDLSNNSLRWLPDELFTALPALAALNLSHNRLQCIPSSFWLCTSLRRLELQCGEREAAPERALVGVGRASTHSAIPERATSRNATRGPSSAAQVRMSGGATSTCLRFFPPPLPEELLDEGGGDPHPDSVGWGVAGSPSAGSHKSVAMGAAAAAVAAAAVVVTTTPAVPQGRGQAAPIGAGHSGASAVSPRASLGRATTPFGLVPAPVTEAGHPVTAAAPGAFHGLHGRPTDSVPAAPATPGRAVVDGSGAKAGTERGPADAAQSPRRAGQTGRDSHPGGGDGGGDAGAGGLGSRARADSAVAPAAVAVSATATAIATDADGEGFRAALVHVSAADAAGLDVDAGPSALVSLPLAASSSGRWAHSGSGGGSGCHASGDSGSVRSALTAQPLRRRRPPSPESHAAASSGALPALARRLRTGSAAGDRFQLQMDRELQQQRRRHDGKSVQRARASSPAGDSTTDCDEGADSDLVAAAGHSAGSASDPAEGSASLAAADRADAPRHAAQRVTGVRWANASPGSRRPGDDATALPSFGLAVGAAGAGRDESCSAVRHSTSADRSTMVVGGVSHRSLPPSSTRPTSPPARDDRAVGPAHRPSRSAGFALGWNAHSRALSAASSSQTHAQSLQQRGGHISGGSHAGSYAGSYAGSHAGSAAGSRLLPNLAHVDLTGCGVEVLLPTVSELSALVRLRLNRNQLRSLPAELADLPALTIVDVEDNPLTRVPAAVKAKRGVQLVTGVPDQILPGLYLGDARAARNVEALRARQIHRVVMVSCELRPQLGAGLDTVVIPIKDAPSESLAFSRCPDPYFFRFAMLPAHAQPTVAGLRLQDHIPEGEAAAAAAAAASAAAATPPGASARARGSGALSKPLSSRGEGSPFNPGPAPAGPGIHTTRLRLQFVIDRSVHRLRAVGRRVLVGLGEHGDTGSDGGESAFSTPEAGAMEGATTPHFAPEEADLPLSAASIAAPILGVGGMSALEEPAAASGGLLPDAVGVVSDSEDGRELFGGDGAPGVLPEPADGARASAGDSWASVDGSRAESSLGDGRDGQATGAPRARAPPLPAPFPVPVFVHCQAGASRSATIVIALVMRVTGWSLRRSFAHVRARRAVVSPNFGFFAQLQRFEKTLYEHGLLHLDDDDKAGLGPGEDPAACLPTLSVTGLVAATSGCINPNVWEARYGSGTAGSGSQAKGGIGSKLSGKSTGGIAGRRGAGPRRDLAEPDEDPEAERHGAFWYASGASAEGPSTRRRQMRRNSVTGF
ncbi:hypothetical protein FNF29_07270 [Cafeteria roenbergensis]|uniref:protein-tyrosine-phosphatase n=1 Tax=Cafeteria roenbergensis TaxID=33653 RepID=A0A5A8C404_CAFRO|nr:hypothetical protein FNF29_07270 [Cafeteria roenbergensis]|eukprot:KAA0147525.1 hypothetical protein FNF29_07270 [Cafeteria roenbergensis]